ncbi:trypsin-like peptidase domain-containing protein [Nibricoccus sp. IMCC34717]|uniref:trypsin-like peptidase domain-containing protein n=1 Tax=Nibricoccus sp. IMCC34717 TaxID=3034021 RepID=UPI00384AF320
MKFLPIAAALIVSLCLTPAFAVSTVKLKNGTTVQGDVLAERADRVVVDLGFTVLTIPRDEVDRIEAEQDSAAKTGNEERGEFYRTATGNPTLTVKENVARVSESVVQVRTPSGLGSGFIIDPRGYLVTNAHVVSGEYALTVTMFRKAGSALSTEVFQKVQIVALDSDLDLALLKIEDVKDGTAFPTVPLGDADGLTEGQTVFAIGSPLGLDRTVSQGIVSTRNRAFGGQLYIQTTTQINPGNSGGPLFNLRGEVVGVNNMKPMITGVEGVSFSIPSTVLKVFLRNREAFAFDARNPNAGFRYLQPPTTVRQERTPKN